MMQIMVTQQHLAPSPIPVQSCFFCGMPVSAEMARGLIDAEQEQLQPRSSSTCLDCPPEQLQQYVTAKLNDLLHSAAQLSHQAERLRHEAATLERMAQVLLIQEALQKPALSSRQISA